MTEDRVEEVEHDGVRSRWIHDTNHGPWQVTAPIWAVQEFRRVRAMMTDGRWFSPIVVGGLGEGHLVHCDGLWDHGKLIAGPERDSCYEATVEWSDGTTGPLLPWNWTGTVGQT